MSTKIDRREDANPKEGMREDGDVEFADLTKQDRAAERHASADAHNAATRRSQQRAKLVSPFLGPNRPPQWRRSRLVRSLGDQVTHRVITIREYAPAAILDRPVSDRGTLRDLSQWATTRSSRRRKLLILNGETGAVDQARLESEAGDAHQVIPRQLFAQIDSTTSELRMLLDVTP